MADLPPLPLPSIIDGCELSPEFSAYADWYTADQMRDYACAALAQPAALDAMPPDGVCKGAWALGTACGTCSKCLATKPDAQPVANRADEFDLMLSTLRYVMNAGQAANGATARDHYNAIINAIANRAERTEAADVRFACEAVKRAALAQAAQPAPQPLSDEQIAGIATEATGWLSPPPALFCLARAIEAAHGITAAPASGKGSSHD